MTTKDLKELYSYSFWSNRKLFDVIDQFTEEEFTREIAGSYASVRNTLIHMLSAEWGWLDRCGGHLRGPSLKGEDYASLDEVKAAFKKVESYITEFLNELQESDLVRLVSYDSGAP
ncbi:MAG: DinB family protein, partial [Rhodothermales bacterium]